MLKHAKGRGQYQGCFSESKWGGRRKIYRWDLFVACAERMSKRMCEVPNVLRPVLGIKGLKAAGRAVKKGGASTACMPTPLALGIESIVLDRIQAGEQVTHDYVSKLTVHMAGQWNHHIEKFREQAVEALGQWALKDVDNQLSTEASNEQIEASQQMAAEAMQDAMQALRPFEFSLHPKALQHLGPPRRLSTISRTHGGIETKGKMYVYNPMCCFIYIYIYILEELHPSFIDSSGLKFAAHAPNLVSEGPK